MTWKAMLLVMFGGALGSGARYAAAAAIGAAAGAGFPWGTLAVNVAGSFLIGVVHTLAWSGGVSFLGADARVFLMVGVLGGFTTFSAFSLQTLELMRGGAMLAAGANVLSSVALCLVAVWLGHLAATALFR